MIELEKKVWLDYPEKILTWLNQKAVYKGDFLKQDSYYVHSSDLDKLDFCLKDPNLFKNLAMFRIRRIENQYFLTYKKREIQNSYELNQEYEIEIDKVLKWKHFFSYINYKEVISKTKNVKLFKYQDCLLEYNYIKELGYFLEIEVLNPKNLEMSMKTIHSIFSLLKLDRFEVKPYTYLIFQKRNQHRYE